MSIQVIRRMAAALLVVALASVLVFVMVDALGDPLAELRQRNPPVPAQVIENRRQELGLDRPLPVRYAEWLGGVVRGDLGEDLRGQPVAPMLGRHLLVTLRLVGSAMAVAVVASVVIGTYTAFRQHSLLDNASTTVAFVLLSTPVFWLSTLLKEHVAIPLNQALGYQVLYTVGYQTPNPGGGRWERLANSLGHLALPAFALAIVLVASWSRYQRAATLEVLGTEEVRMARATGAGRRRVLFHHIQRRVIGPLASVVAVDASAIIGGAVLIEKVFAWQGMGTLLVTAVTDRDSNLVLGWLMVTGVLVVVLNLAADIFHAWADPRIRRD